MKIRRLGEILLCGIFMSLAWSLRGQFGHMKGALIPGAAAAILVSLLPHAERWRHSYGRALAWTALGFGLGGEISYGWLIERFLDCDNPVCFSFDLTRLFLTGVIWGGVGMSVLGAALSEKPMNERDFVFWALLAMFWFVPLEILGKDAYEIFLLGLGLSAIGLYNFFWRKSEMLSLFAFAGAFGFGLGFSVAVVILYLGQHAFLRASFPWWLLRDQIIGFAGGIVVAWAIMKAPALRLAPSWTTSQFACRFNLVFFAAVIPAINTINVLRHWLFKHPLASPALFWVLVIAMLLLLSWSAVRVIRNPYDIRFAILFFSWYLSGIAIAKNVLPAGLAGWESAHTCFVIFCVFLSLFLRVPSKR
jgi:hypothetical protein